mgnify:FL=1
MKGIEASLYRIMWAVTIAGIVIFAPLRFLEVYGRHFQ